MGQPSESSGSSHPSLVAADLRADSRIAEARRLIAEAVADHSRGIQDVRAGDPDLSVAYEQLLSRLADTRGGPPFWPYLSSGLGHGPYVELADGSVKLDFIGGIGVHGAGHSHEAMIDAALDAALEDTVMQGNLQQHPPSIKLSERLIKMASAGGAAIDHCLLSTSGAMAPASTIATSLALSKER